MRVMFVSGMWACSVRGGDLSTIRASGRWGQSGCMLAPNGRQRPIAHVPGRLTKTRDRFVDWQQAIEWIRRLVARSLFDEYTNNPGPLKAPRQGPIRPAIRRD